ncbi:hypothetical protein PIB30_011378 [Stylosanthes scabra]|uniref:Uncharacterized protein n=1 Tax=Stylosanthes scabra TaxID=79078 RepID=A0ABU6Y5W6_9FABA|nr:hypothetical protein [Stylosanthes scabra]
MLSLATVSSFYGSLSDLIIVQTGTVNDYFGTVNDYFDAFFAHAENVGFTNLEILIPFFINGFKIQIHREIFGKQYSSLLDVWLNEQTNPVIQVNLANPDPEIQKSEQVEAEPEFHTQIESAMQEQCHLIQHSRVDSDTKFQEQESENQQSEYEIDEVDPATGPEFTTGTKPQLDSKEKNRSQSQIQEDDESDEKSICHGFNARSTLVAANRPPPKPPNFTEDGSGEQRSLAHEIGCTTPGVGDEGLVASSGAKDGAVAKGKLESTEVEPVKDGVHDSKTTLCKGGERSTASNGAIVNKKPVTLMAATTMTDLQWDTGTCVVR